jgi:AraC family transcriptional regulator of arabinose operon
MLLSGHDTFRHPARAAVRFKKAWTIDMTISGSVMFGHAAGDVPLRPNEVLLVKPDRAKSWYVPAGTGKRGNRFPGRWEVVWHIFEPEERTLAWMQYDEIRPGYIRLQLRNTETARQVALALKRAHGLATSHLAGREDLALNAIEEALIRCHHDQKGGVRPVDERVERALRFLHENLGRPVRVAHVAAACGLSRARLLALFKRQIGVPMMSYLEQERLRRARQLLAQPALSIKQIAAGLGYADARYFAKRFKRAAGMRPTAWRKARAHGSPSRFPAKP